MERSIYFSSFMAVACEQRRHAATQRETERVAARATEAKHALQLRLAGGAGEWCESAGSRLPPAKTVEHVVLSASTLTEQVMARASAHLIVTNEVGEVDILIVRVGVRVGVRVRVRVGVITVHHEIGCAQASSILVGHTARERSSEVRKGAW